MTEPIPAPVAPTPVVPTPVVPDPAVVTPEMRQAVYDDDCKRLGHLFNVKVDAAPTADPNLLRAWTDLEVPHVLCKRCQRVWLIVATAPGKSYPDAEVEVQKALKPGDNFNDRITEIRDRREAAENAPPQNPGLFTFGHGHEHLPS